MSACPRCGENDDDMGITCPVCGYAPAPMPPRTPATEAGRALADRWSGYRDVCRAKRVWTDGDERLYQVTTDSILAIEDEAMDIVRARVSALDKYEAARPDGCTHHCEGGHFRRRRHDHERTARLEPTPDYGPYPNVPGCTCDRDDDSNEDMPRTFCPYHEERLRHLRWDTLACLVIDYEAALRVLGPPAPDEPIGWNYLSDDDMCPNCVTPWKCNGPHDANDTRGQRRAWSR